MVPALETVIMVHEEVLVCGLETNIHCEKSLMPYIVIGLYLHFICRNISEPLRRQEFIHTNPTNQVAEIKAAIKAFKILRDHGTEHMFFYFIF